MNRRSFLALLPAALILPELLLPKRTFFLPPSGGWSPMLWGDGIHDDREALQRLVDAQLRVGNIVNFPCGTYALGSAVIISQLARAGIQVDGGGSSFSHLPSNRGGLFRVLSDAGSYSVGV